MSAIINLLVTSENASSERRFDKAISILQLKEKLEIICGTSAQLMQIQLFDTNDKLVSNQLENDKLLGYYSVENYYRLNVINCDPYRIKNEYSDVSHVKKFELAEEEYDKRSDTVREFLKQNKLGKYAPASATTTTTPTTTKISHLNIGDRCQITSTDISNDTNIDGGGGDENDDYRKRGVVKFIGETDFKDGIWVGVEYDEPIGKNDGRFTIILYLLICHDLMSSVNGIRYFQCRPKHGAFIRPDKVETGDFPEQDEFSDLEEL